MSGAVPVKLAPDATGEELHWAGGAPPLSTQQLWFSLQRLEWAALIIVPADAVSREVTPERLEGWVTDGWVDLRLANCARWIERFQRIQAEVEAIPPGETSSRYLRDRRFWQEGRVIQPGKIVGWILSVEEKGWRVKR